MFAFFPEQKLDVRKFQVGAIVELKVACENRLGVTIGVLDDTGLPDQIERARQEARKLGLGEYCRRCREFGLNKQVTWKNVRMYFAEVGFRQFSRLFDRLD